MRLEFSSQELSLFVRGDLRTDGWKSAWRIDLERRMAEEARNPVPKQKPKTKRPIVKEDRAYHRVLCRVCSRPMRAGSKTNIHVRCARKREKCACGRTLKIDWPRPICGRCYRRAERENELAGRRICAEPGCGSILRPDSTSPHCRKHSTEWRRAKLAEYQRKRREKHY